MDSPDGTDYSVMAISEIIEEWLPEGHRVAETGPIRDLIERYQGDCESQDPLLTWNPDAE